MTDRPFNAKTFRELLSQGKLMGSRCTSCRTVRVPPRPICPGCRETCMEWVSLSGRGRLLAFTCISVVPPLMQSLGFGRDKPYCSAVIELEEGCRVVARLDGIDPGKPEEIEIGMPLVVKFERRVTAPGEASSLLFEPQP